MTKRHHKQLERERDPYYRAKPVEKPLGVGHGLHRLDGPSPRRPPASKAPCMEQAAALVDAAVAWAGESHPPLFVVELPGAPTVRVAQVFAEAGLSAQEQRAWTLYCAGFSYFTIAEFMDGVSSVSTVETYLSRGRRKLRAHSGPQLMELVNS